jgi:N-acylglucosamine-6-phosphate 2-epimerase
MKNLPPVARRFEHRLIVSCPAAEGDPFRDSSCMARFATAAVAGGAAGIRANGAAAPIIGICAASTGIGAA